MSMRVPPIGPAAGREQSRVELEKSLARLASGRRIVRAGDDAAGLAISEQLRARDRALMHGTRNLADGLSLVRTAEGGLAAISDNLVRMRELAVQAGDGALGAEEQSALQSEFDALSAEISRIAGGTRFGDRALLDGQTSGAQAATLRDGTGPEGIVRIAIPDRSAASLGVADLRAADPEALEVLDAALGAVSETRAELGATERRLEAGIRNLQESAESSAAAGSRIQDADFARAAAEYMQQRIQQDVESAVAAQAHLTGRFALELLR